jgi:NTE family protein
LGLTLIQRAAGHRPLREPKIALVLAGGAVAGGAFKVGGLQALDRCLVGRGVNDLDFYVGLSAGAFLATSLAGGVRPDEMEGALEGTSERISQLRPIDFYRPNVSEFVGRPLRFAARVAGYLPGLAMDLLSALPDLPSRLAPGVRKLVDEPKYSHVETLLMDLFEEISPKREFPALTSLIPSGVFDNQALGKWLATNLAAIDLPNQFGDFYRETGKKLFIAATRLDTAERVVFGPEDDHGLTISEAVQASSAVPGLFRPARINGVDYVDGGVLRTANIDVAIEQGANLIICYNPFRPYLHRAADAPGRDGHTHLADRGGLTVISQVFRAMLHTRLQMGLRSYLQDDRFRGDIVVIEARETDEQFFDLNPLAFWRRAEGLRHGFESVRQTLEDHAAILGRLFESYGLEFRLPEAESAEMEEHESESGDEQQGVPLRLVGSAQHG